MSNIQNKKSLLILIALLIQFVLINNSYSQVDFYTADLSTFQVDQLSDEQIIQLLKKAQSMGLSQQQLESSALNRGMNQSEIQKLRDRIAIIQQSSQYSNQKGQPDREKTELKIEKPEEVEINETGTIKKLKIFGRDLFNTKYLTFEPGLNLPTPKNYQLGPGDELIIDIWGASQAGYKQTVSPEGTIFISNIGPINVNGLTIEKATEKIINRLTSIYAGLSGQKPNTYAQVSLGNVKSIKVTLVGDVQTPGTYTLPSLATVFNALYVSGGPSDNGSFRNINIYRDNQLAANLDVYDFLINGAQKNNIRLQDQDIIMVKPYNIRVEIAGEVKRPGYYEMKDIETIDDLIRFAGGFTNKAYTYLIKITRNTPKQYRVVEVLKEEFSKTNLKNGDIITIETILNKYENRVQIHGAVFRPGTYQLTDSLTLKQLIEKADGLKGDAFTDRSILYRTKQDYTIEAVPFDLNSIIKGNESDILLQKDDEIRIFSIFELREEYSVDINGEVLNPGTYPFIMNLTLGDIIATAGGFKESASLSKIEIARRIKDNYSETSTSSIARTYVFKVNKNLTLADTASSFRLNPFDIVYIRRSPGYQVQNTATIEGEVNFPGAYTIANKNERISDFIARAGGLTPEAYIKGAKLIRVTGQPDKAEILHRIQQQTTDSVLYTMEQTNEKTIGIDLEKILNMPETEDDLLIQEGDRLVIPKLLQTVTLNGALLYPITVRYDKSYSFRKYITQAGGFAENAKKSKSYIIYANGTANRAKRLAFINLYPRVEPGAEIFVPIETEKKERRITAQELVALSTSISSMALVIISIVKATE